MNNNTRFWVVGGKYSDMNFSDIVPGTENVFGPFPTRRQAEDTWRQVSHEHRSQCLTRFVITAEGSGQRAQALHGHA
ncbi:hypothetical protein [Pseudoxanthobacter sp.]|uniref:DUF4170 domain-containing protein n=1 Tax=Pseudoxanthobacter sp. TaxID=1925742 RepID=UPI002FE10FC5